jgi:hypothetical protein
MKDIAKLMVRNRLPPRTTRSPQVLPSTPEITRRESQIQAEKVPETASVYSALDSWRPNARRALQEEQVSEDSVDLISREEFEKIHRPGRKPIHEKKRRNICLSMSVSVEEADLLRRFAASMGLGYSEWARATLFESMGKKIPKRK